MNTIELLVLNGSPGSGKSTLAEAVLERLRAANVPCALIDADQIALAYPDGEKNFEWRREFMWKNLAAVWPNYAALGDLKIIIPMVIDDDRNLEMLRAVTPGARLSICELVAPVDVLRERITRRQPYEHSRERLFALIDRYDQKRQDNAGKYTGFEVSTNHRSIEDVTNEILSTLQWL